MEYHFREGRLYLHRTAEEKAPILQRLRRIEGQVRGLQQMLEEDRYCLDEVQQANAISAAIREAALLIISDHLAAGVDYAAKAKDSRGAVQDMVAVLRAALRQ
ncbi:MAG: metal-sensitive transcriptional regulator [Acidisphaera sp.]|nr:metal-sensitive transcriptional regulator [Acidisphaera sp.]